jgi:RNA polymerase sigma factor (sigma-70 family)
MELVSTSDVCEYPVATMKPSETAQFESRLQQHGGIIRKVVFGYARTESDRNDLMQDILLQLWKAYPRYSSDRPFSTWMYRIALNVSISYLRKHTRRGGRRCDSMSRSTTSPLSNQVRRKWKSA